MLGKKGNGGKDRNFLPVPAPETVPKRVSIGSGRIFAGTRFWLEEGLSHFLVTKTGPPRK